MNIWIVSLADGATRQLTQGAGGDFQPRWSPDGRRIVFFSSRAGNTDIWSVDADTGELQALTMGSALEINPFYSPDGSAIAFHSNRGGRKEVWIMAADGSGQRRLSNVGVEDHFMLWSDDSQHVLFRSFSDPRHNVWRVAVAGGDAEPVARVQGGAHMSYSPDRRLVLDVTAHKTLWVSPLDGGAPRRVYEYEQPDVRIDYPTWTTDGRWVLFDRWQPQGGDIWLIEQAE